MTARGEYHAGRAGFRSLPGGAVEITIRKSDEPDAATLDTVALGAGQWEAAVETRKRGE